MSQRYRTEYSYFAFVRQEIDQWCFFRSKYGGYVSLIKNISLKKYESWNISYRCFNRDDIWRYFPRMQFFFNFYLHYQVAPAKLWHIFSNQQLRYLCTDKTSNSSELLLSSSPKSTGVPFDGWSHARYMTFLPPTVLENSMPTSCVSNCN